MKRDLQPLLDVQQLHKRFTLHLRGGVELAVLSAVSLQVHAGECVALVGPSGRGKSTLVKCLFGSYGADGGSMRFAASGGAVDLAAASPQQWIAMRQRDIAYVSQFLRVMPRVPAIDVVAERVVAAQRVEGDDGDESHRRRWALARESAAALLQRLNVPATLWQLPPATFSGGEQQRINIARGFVEPSRLLLLDEPTASLDADNRRVVIALIEEAKTRGAAVIGIFHDEEVRDAVASRCIALGAQA